MLTDVMRRAPPISAIEAFLVAATAGSFRVAADELNLSPPAITRRVQALEQHVGAKLFERRAGGITLTARGRELVVRLGPAMGAIAAAVSRSSTERDQVRLRVSRSLAALWLVPRLARRPAPVALDLRADLTLQNLRDGVADLGIFYGEPAGSGLIAIPFLPVELSVVSALQLADGRPAPARLDELSLHRLLTLSNPPGIWRRLLPEATEFLTFDGIQVMYEAAAHGLGVAPGLNPLVGPYLTNRRLVELNFCDRTPVGAYYLVATEQALQDRAVADLWHWLVVESQLAPHP